MTYIDSKYIKVYPSAYRSYKTSGTPFDPESKLPTENNIINQTNPIVQGLTNGKDSYIISPTSQSLSSITSGSIVFVIHGYKFEVDAVKLKALFTINFNNIYAKIVLTDANTANVTLGTNTDYKDTHLSPITETQDADLDTSTSNFVGVGFIQSTSEPPSEANTYYLHLTNSEGTLVSTSYLTNMIDVDSMLVDDIQSRDGTIHISKGDIDIDGTLDAQVVKAAGIEVSDTIKLAKDAQSSPTVTISSSGVATTGLTASNTNSLNIKFINELVNNDSSFKVTSRGNIIAVSIDCNENVDAREITSEAYYGNNGYEVDGTGAVTCSDLLVKGASKLTGNVTNANDDNIITYDSTTQKSTFIGYLDGLAVSASSATKCDYVKASHSALLRYPSSTKTVTLTSDAIYAVYAIVGPTDIGTSPSTGVVGNNEQVRVMFPNLVTTYDTEVSYTNKAYYLVGQYINDNNEVGEVIIKITRTGTTYTPTLMHRLGANNNYIQLTNTHYNIWFERLGFVQ